MMMLRDVERDVCMTSPFRRYHETDFLMLTVFDAILMAARTVDLPAWLAEALTRSQLAQDRSLLSPNSIALNTSCDSPAPPHSTVTFNNGKKPTVDSPSKDVNTAGDVCMHA